MKNLPGKINRKILKGILRKSAFPLEKNHYIFSEMRAGSSWLMEIISRLTGDIKVWEPLNLAYPDNPFHRLNFAWRQEIPITEEWPEAEALFAELFSGNDLSENMLSQNNLRSAFSAEALLFKICRGNALLPWLSQHFTFHNKPVLLLRHPCAVVASQMKHGAWDDLSYRFYFPEDKKQASRRKHHAFLKTIRSPEEYLLAHSCMGFNCVLSSKEYGVKWHVIHYENLVRRPEEELSGLLKEWGMDKSLSNLDFRAPSVSSLGTKAKTAEQLIYGWQSRFDSREMQGLKRVMAYFSPGIYAIDDALPKE